MASKPEVSYWLTMVLERNARYLADIPISVLTTGNSVSVESSGRHHSVKAKPRASKALTDARGG